MRATQRHLPPQKKREKKGDVETLREGQICAENLFQVAHNLPFLKKTCFTTEAKRSTAGGLKMRGRVGWNTSKSAERAGRAGREKLLEAERRTKVRRGKMRRVKRVTAKAAAVRRNGADLRLSRRLLVYPRRRGRCFSTELMLEELADGLFVDVKTHRMNGTAARQQLTHA